MISLLLRIFLASFSILSAANCISVSFFFFVEILLGGEILNARTSFPKSWIESAYGQTRLSSLSRILLMLLMAFPSSSGASASPLVDPDRAASSNIVADCSVFSNDPSKDSVLRLLPVANSRASWAYK